MHQIFKRAKDKNVAITMVYSNSDNDFLYSDVKRNRKLSKDEVLDLCMNGVAIELPGQTVFSPIHVKENGNGVEVICFDGETSYTFKSEEVV